MGVLICHFGKTENLEVHKEIVKKIVRSKTKTSREKLEKEYGVRYSVLLELAYFDPVE